MTDPIPRLIAAGYRRLIRLADAAEQPAAPDEPDVAAAQARIEAAGGQVMSLDEWARTSCPSLAAEADAIRTATTPADL